MTLTPPWCVIVPWVSEAQVDQFLKAWSIEALPDWLILQHDEKREGTGYTKNRGIEKALRRGAEVVIVLDDDCFPHGEVNRLEILAERHIAALEPQTFPLFQIVTDPPSRGTPYTELTATLPIAASLGFWAGHGDYCAVRQLNYANAPMKFYPQLVYGRYFPLCGMNVAYRPLKWLPWCEFIDVRRFDDIWMGWLWQREAWRRGAAFNLSGPVIQHARQSNVWSNLDHEAKYLQRSETLWRDIALHPAEDYATLRALLPV